MKRVPGCLRPRSILTAVPALMLAVGALACGGPTAGGGGDDVSASTDAGTDSFDTASAGVDTDDATSGTADDTGSPAGDGVQDTVPDPTDGAAPDGMTPDGETPDTHEEPPDVDAVGPETQADDASDAPSGDSESGSPDSVADASGVDDADNDTDALAPGCVTDEECELEEEQELLACEALRCVDGACVVGAVDDGTACDDSDPCTASDSCTGGVCSGTDVDCSDLDAPCLAGVCNILDGECTAVATDEGLACDDGDPCTDSDVCDAGSCTGATKDCSEADGPCMEGVCAAGSGECVPAPLDGVACDDADPCTQEDTCAEGVCGGAQVVCEGAAALPCHTLACDSATGTCVETPGLDGEGCDDGDKCTTGDVCGGGECGGTPLACDFLDGACKQGSCDAAIGACVQLDIPSGTPCDDGQPCTAEDVCTGGICLGQQLDCQAEAGPCEIGACDVETGGCEFTPLGAGTPCDDGDACTTADVCFSGACSGLPTSCADLDGPCQEGVCDPQTGDCAPSPFPDDTVCDDGLICTDGDHCIGGACLGAGPDCSALDGVCVLGVCDDDGMGCKQIPAPIGSACDDGSLCTTEDACDGDGSCEGDEVTCEDGASPCIVGSCDPADGSCSTVALDDGAPCDDGNGCTEGDTCLATVCVSTPKDCTHLDNDCSVGFCSPAVGECLMDSQPDGVVCSDGNLCTLFDVCDAGQCVGQELDCSSLDDPCNIGKCNPDTAACFKSPAGDGNSCNDLDACTKLDTCSEGVCSGAPVDCSHLEGACIQAACNPSSGLCASSLRPDGTPCDDGNPCTENGECSAGFCATDNVDCTAFQSPCTIAMCNPSTGQCFGQNKTDGSGCNDNDPCTLFDGCKEGECQGFVKDCSAFDGPCTEGFCNSVNGFCQQELYESGTPCDDGNPCTGPDVCQGFTCFAPENPDLPSCVGACDGAIVVAELPFTYADTTANDSDTFSADACGVPGGGQGSPDVLFEFTPLVDATYRIRLTPLDFDPTALDAIIYLTSGCPAEASSICQGVADVQGQAGGDEIVKSLGAGTTLFIVVDGAAGAPEDAGSFVLLVDEVPPNETDCDDELDDDADGKTDCDDEDCSEEFECVVEVADGALAITEVMGQPGGTLADPTAEFIEVTNPTDAATPSEGIWLTVRSWAEGDAEPTEPQGAWQHTSGAPLEPGDTIVFAHSSDSALNGAIAPNGSWSGAFDIPNEGHVRIQLVQPTWDGTGNPTAGQRIDEVVVPAGTFSVAARSWMLDETAMADPAAGVLNDSAANWCLTPAFADLVYSSGNHGTPGIGNPPCTAP